MSRSYIPLSLCLQPLAHHRVPDGIPEHLYLAGLSGFIIGKDAPAVNGNDPRLDGSLGFLNPLFIRLDILQILSQPPDKCLMSLRITLNII